MRAGNEVARIVALLAGRVVRHVPVPVVGPRTDRDGGTLLVRHEGHPLDDLLDTVEVVVGRHVRDTVLVHDLRATELQVGGVDLSTQQLVDSRSAGQDDRLTLDLDGPLSKTDKVRTDTNGAASDQGNGEDVLVRLGGGTGDETRTLQTLNAQAVLGTDHGGDLVALFTILGDRFRDHLLLLAGIELLLDLGSQVKILEPSLGLGRVVPGDREERKKFVSHPNTRTRVGRKVDARDAELPCQLRALVEELVLQGTERTDLEGDVVGNDDEASATRVLGSTGSDDPTDHAVGVGAGATRDLDQIVGIIQDQFVVVDALANRRALVDQRRDLLQRLRPAVLERLSEQLGEIVHVLGTHDVGLVTLGLQPLLGRVRRRDRAQVHRAELVAATDALEDPVSLLGFLLHVELHLDDETVRVGDDDTQGIRHASGRVSAQDTDLGAGDTQTPQATAKSVQETGQGLLYVMGLEVEDGGEVDEDVVQIRVVVSNDLQRIQDIGHETVGFGDEVLSRRDIVTQATGTDDGAHKVPLIHRLVVLRTLANGLVDMDVPVFSEHGGDLELGQTSKLQLERQGRLAVTNAFVLLVGGATEGVVAGIDAVLAADEGHAANAAGQELTLEVVDQRGGLLDNLRIVEIFDIANGDVQNASQLVVTLAPGGRASLALEVRKESVVAALLGLGHGEALQGAGQGLLGILQILDGDNDTLPHRVTGAIVDQVGQLAEGVDPLEGVAGLGSRGVGSGGVCGGDRAVFRLSDLAQREVPAQQRELPCHVVVHILQGVGTVGTAHVHLEGGQRDPDVLVDKEAGEHIEHGILGVHHLLQHRELGLPVLKARLPVPRLHHRGAQDQLHLRHALLHRGQSALDQDLTGLEADLGRRAGFELRQLLEDGLEVLAHVTNTGLVGAVHRQDGQDEVVLGADAAVRQNRVDDAEDVILVLLAKLQDGIFVANVAVREQLLDIVVLLEQAAEDAKLVALQPVHVLVDHVQQRQEGGLQDLGIGGVDVLFDEPRNGLLQLLGGELGLARLGALDDALELGIQLLRHAGVQGRRLSIPLAIRKFRVPEDLHELLQCRGHDHLVVIPTQDVLQDAVQEEEPLGRLAAHDLRGAQFGQLASERLRVLDARGIVQGQDAENVAGLEGRAGLLDQLDDTVLLGDQRHVHLHHLDLGEGLARAHVLTALHGELDQLTGGRGAELRGVVLLLQQTGLAVDTDASGGRLLLPVDVVAATGQQDQQAAVGQGTHAHRALGSVDEDVVAVVARARGGELVPGALVDEVHGEDGLEDILGGYLTLLQPLAVLLHAGFAGLVRLGDGTAQDRDDGVGALGGQLVGDQLVQPPGGDGVLLEGGRLQQLDEVLDGRPEITADAQFLEGDDHVFARRRAVLTVGEDVTELAVGEAVDTTRGTDGEVTPDVGRTPEVQLVHGSAGRLEALTGVLRGDPARGGVTLGLRATLGLEALLAREVKVEVRGGVGVDAVEQADVPDAVEGDTHGDLELRGGQVDAGDHFGGRVLDLETGVQLQEVELVVGVRVEVLDGTRGDVTDQATQADGGLLHRLEGGRFRDGHGRLLDDLLVTSLHGAVATKQGDVVPVLIRQQLHFQMTGIAGELHDEDGRPGDLRRGGVVQGDEVLLLLDLANTLTAATFGRLDHDGEPDLLGLLQALLGGESAPLVVDLVCDGDDPIVIDRDLLDTSAGPRNAGYPSVLRDNRRGDLVTQRSHGGGRGPNEDDLLRRSRQRLGKPGVFRGMAPTGPNGVHVHSFSDIDDQIDVGIVVVIRPTGNLTNFLD